MKQWMGKTAAGLAVAALLWAAMGARAGGVDPKYIPADAKWVIHVDVDAVTKGKLWSLLKVNLDALSDHRQLSVGIAPEGGAPPAASEKIKIVADALGMRLPEDIHGITLVGRSFDETGAVLLVHGKFDKDRLIGMAKLNPGYLSALHEGVEVSSWTQGGQEGVSGAFLADDVIAFGRSAADVEEAIDHQGTGGASGLLAGGESVEGAGVMVYLAAEGLAELQKKAELSPILAPVTRVRASIGESGDDVVLKAVLSLKSEEAARQVRGALEGVRAMVTLATLEEHAEPTLKMVAELSRRATSTAGGTTVAIEWPVAVATIQRMVEEQAYGGRHSATRRAPATQATTGEAK